jgi:hypothetical protein
MLNTFTVLALTAGLLAAPQTNLFADDPVPDDPIPEDPIPDDPIPEEPEEAVEVSIEKLTSIEYRPGQELPDEIAELDGKTVTIEGYMAIGTLEGVQKFELVPEPCECGRSKVQHFIDVTLTEGTTTFTPGRIELEGKLSVSEVEEDGFVVSLYRLEIKSLDN